MCATNIFLALATGTCIGAAALSVPALAVPASVALTTAILSVATHLGGCVNKTICAGWRLYFECSIGASIQLLAAESITVEVF